jgi:5-methylcytosine-specific restriction endonuclease McrA
MQQQERKMRLIDPRNGKQLTLDVDLAVRWAKEFSDLSSQECEHKRQELRRGQNMGGHPVIRMQCLDCGLRLGKAFGIKQTPNADELSGFDDEMHNAYKAERKAVKEKIDQKYVEVQLRRWKAKEQGDSYYQQAHNAYLSSPEWRARRKLVLDRSQGLCEGCRLAPPTEVHHLSYEHWGHELLFELVALCGDCHDRIHAKGDHEALVEGCKACLHASRGNFCRLYDVPMVTALEAEELCTFERDGFEPAK